MVYSKARTVAEYLKELPEDRRKVVSSLRKLIVRHLPKGYEERVNWGMITYELPLERFPDTYNKQPLCYLALAAQKNYNALYMMGVYADKEQSRWLREEFKKEGKKLDIGKSCLRFRALDDLPLDAIGRIIASTPPKKMIALYEASRKR